MAAYRSRLHRAFAGALVLLSPAAADARADPACLAAPDQGCAFAWALSTARAERLDVSLRIGGIAIVASALAQAGRSAEAQAAFREALALADALRPNPAVDGTIAFLAGRQATAGMVEDGLAVARAIADPKARAKAFEQIATALIERGRFQDALATARAIEIPEARSDALVIVGRALAEAGRADEAIAAARAIPEDEKRVSVLHMVADLLARERKPEADAVVREGLALARKMSDEARRATFVGLFAGALARMGRDGEAMDVAGSVANPELRHTALGSIASAQAETGRIDAALATLNLIDTRRRERNSPVFARTAAIRDIVLALAKARRLDEAKAMASRMGNVNDYRYVAWRGIALARADTLVFSVAIAEARELAPDEREHVLIALLPRLLGAREFEEAHAIARALVRDHDRAPALAAVGTALLKVGRKREAETAFREAMVAAMALPEGYFRGEGLAKVALLLPR